MSRQNETFFTSIGCMDGRVQDPIEHFGQKLFGAEYPDTITEAGFVGLLARLQMPSARADSGQAKNNIDRALLDSIKKKILISLEKHHSKGIIIHGHQECAGNPVDDRQHKKDVLKAAKIIAKLVSEKIKVIPVFVKRRSHNWAVEEL